MLTGCRRPSVHTRRERRKAEVHLQSIKCICKCDSNLNRTISIVTLPHIHQSWQTTDFSQIEIVETEFSTCKSRDNTVRRCLFYKFCVIVSSRFSTITAGNQKEMTDMRLILQLLLQYLHGTGWLHDQNRLSLLYRH